MEKNAKFITREDFQKIDNRPITWVVLAPKEDVVMSSHFANREDAESFCKLAYCGYYSDCRVQCVKNNFYKGI